MTKDQSKPGYVCAWAFHPGHWVCGNPSCGPCAARGQGFQGGLSNENLRAAFKSKLPTVEPTERDLSIFALGIEAGDRRPAIQKLMAKLADLLDEDQFAHCENIVRAVGVEPPNWTAEDLIADAMIDANLNPHFCLNHRAELIKLGRAVLMRAVAHGVAVHDGEPKPGDTPMTEKAPKT